MMEKKAMILWGLAVILAAIAVLTNIVASGGWSLLTLLISMIIGILVLLAMDFLSDFELDEEKLPLVIPRGVIVVVLVNLITVAVNKLISMIL